jgi:hypothetical protein
MPDESNYTKEPWIDPAQNVQPQGAVRHADLEVREFETYARKRPTGQLGTTEGVKPAEDAKPPEETVALSPQVTALARKEAKFRQSQLALKAERDALEADKAEIAQLKALKAKLAAKDYSGLDDLVDYNEYTNHITTKLASTDPNQQALKKLEDEIKGVKKAHEESISQQFEAAVKERRAAVISLVESNPEFASIKELKQQEAVVQHILDTWEHDEIDLSVEQAAQEVEELLIEEAKKWASITKIRPESSAAEEKKPLPALKSPAKTITNQMTTSDVKAPLKPYYQMSESERYAEARRRVLEKMQKQG